MFLIFCSALSGRSQGYLFYSDVFKGGVTGDGYAPIFNLDNPKTLDLFIEPGSTIRKAYLFATYFLEKPDLIPAEKTVLLNGQVLIFKPEDQITPIFTSMFGTTPWWYHTSMVHEVTEYINPISGSNILTPPINQTSNNLTNFYLFVCYENPLLTSISTSILMSTSDALPTLNYSFGLQNSHSTTNDVAFTFNSTAFCNIGDDGSYVYANGNLLGLTGGDEAPATEGGCLGVRGSFYYQNGLLYGLGNDVANTTMNGVDALANIASCIPVPGVYDFLFEHQSPLLTTKNKTNPVLELFLTYSTPCDTFSVSVPSDTTLCLGTQYALAVQGGQAYQWTATGSPPGVAPGLSCTDCPNPIFSADSTMNYTVQIWNNDSCSVIRPIQLRVNPLAIDSLVLVAPDCGASNGSITPLHSAFQSSQISFVLNGSLMPSGTSISNLAEGFYTLYLQDENGCVGPDTTFFFASVNNTHTQFGLDPTSGNAPLEIDAYNLCQNATNYEWYINGTYSGNDFNGFTLQNGGDYYFELVAWQYDPSCADSFSMWVFVREIIIPSAFTPDGDEINDTWVIQGLTEYLPDAEVRIYDRWGSLVYQADNGTYPQKPWDGSLNGSPLPVASYYYSISSPNKPEEGYTGTVSIVRR